MPGLLSTVLEARYSAEALQGTESLQGTEALQMSEECWKRTSIALRWEASENLGASPVSKNLSTIKNVPYDGARGRPGRRT
jgi:hypothetical protein